MFDGNVPRFFDATKRDGFVRFVDRFAVSSAFQVIGRDGVIVACGGLECEAGTGEVGLCWGMVERARHGGGLGSRLTAARLEAARTMPGVTRVRIETSQRTQGFYRRFGSVPEAVAPDGYGPGLDRWDMVLRLRTARVSD